MNSPNALDGNNDTKLDTASAAFQAECRCCIVLAQKKGILPFYTVICLFFTPQEISLPFPVYFAISSIP